MYVSKNQKKKQQQGQELCLVSMADLDGFYKAGKRAEAVVIGYRKGLTKH